MKNIITILLVLILPICAYLLINKNSNNILAVAKSNTPTLQIYTSTMCIDCQKLKNLINEIEPTYKDSVNFIVINALDKNKKTQNDIKKYGITLVPTIIVFDRSGNQTNKIEGYIEKEKLIAEIEEVING
ncbi:MAG: thioredoxin family protein [Candidatus Gastranaerophilales bacterium]|nr:thioredoxin family protein [Candidatus Gastranaerophilales bacterium]